MACYQIEKREIEAAGFKLVDEGMFLRNPRAITMSNPG
jgi:hypothetical protein